MKPLAANTLLQNRYLIVHLIGKGGMGDVYLAIDQRLGSAVALKRTFFSGDEIMSMAFEREARTLARLRHNVLPKVSDHFTEGDTQYLIMEHIAGDDLAKRMTMSQKPFPLDWVLFWADQLLDALGYLHTQEPPVIHRDIKPQNLKLTDENSIVLLDFGLLKNTLSETRSLTTGSIVGYTPHFAPMEQIRGIGTSPRSDIFSLSATLYQLLTNVVPPDVLTRADDLLSGKPDPLQPVNEINNEISEKISNVILQGMAVTQEHRFADAREMQKALREVHTQTGSLKSSPNNAFDTENHYESQNNGHPQFQTNISVSPIIESKSVEVDASENSNRAEVTPTQQAAQSQQLNTNSTGRFLKVIGLGTVILAMAAGIAWFMLHNTKNAAEKTSPKTPELAATVAPTPAPTLESIVNAPSHANIQNMNDLTSNANIQNDNQTIDNKNRNATDKTGKLTQPAVVKAKPKKPPRTQTTTKATPKPTPSSKATPLPRILP